MACRRCKGPGGGLFKPGHVEVERASTKVVISEDIVVQIMALGNLSRLCVSCTLEVKRTTTAVVKDLGAVGVRISQALADQAEANRVVVPGGDDVDA